MRSMEIGRKNEIRNLGRRRPGLGDRGLSCPRRRRSGTDRTWGPRPASGGKRRHHIRPGRFYGTVEIITNPSSLSKAEVLILAGKTYDTAAAIGSVRHMDVGAALSVQNGIKKN